jgi:hypothetical protein
MYGMGVRVVVYVGVAVVTNVPLSNPSCNVGESVGKERYKRE